MRRHLGLGELGEHETVTETIGIEVISFDIEGGRHDAASALH